MLDQTFIEIRRAFADTAGVSGGIAANDASPNGKKNATILIIVATLILSLIIYKLLK